MIGGRTFFDRYSANSSCMCSRVRFGSRCTKAPQNAPTSEAVFSSGRFSGSFGISPAAKPITRCRPSQAIERNACSV